MFLKKLLIPFFVFNAFIALSQNSTISGTVVDAKTLKAIPNAIISIDGMDNVTSNSLGNFQIWNIPYGNYTLKVNEKNYSTNYQKVNLDADYKYIRILMSEITTITGKEKVSEEPNVVTQIIRDTVYIEKVVEKIVTVEAPNASEINLKAETNTLPNETSTIPLISTNTDTIIKVPTLELDELDNTVDDATNNDNVSAVLNASRDPFYNAAAFTLGAYRFRLRGLDNAEGTLYMNNIEMNDLDIGRPSWTQWGGLNDVMRNRTDIYGLDKSDFAYGGLTGASNIDLRAINQRKEFKVSYAFSNRSYMHRLMGTYSTGEMKGGWAFSLSASYRYANNDNLSEMIRFNQVGTTYDAYSFYAGLDKKFGNNHLLSLNVFGARNKRGTNGVSTQEIMDIAGTNFYNPNWGWQTEPDGKRYKRNSRVNEVFIPTGILMHDWTLKNNSSLKTSVSFRKGINGGTALDWRNATDPRPDYYRNMPSFALIENGQETADAVSSILSSDEDARQVNWDKLYEANYLSQVSVNNPNGTADTATYNIAKYVLAERRYDPTIINFASIFEKKFTDNVTFNLGINYANQKTHNYQKIKDLLGAENYIDLNQFAERDFPDNDSVNQNDLNRPNRILEEGDLYGYNYTFNTRKAAGWAQTAISFNKVDIFLANEVSFTNFWRTGHVRNGLFPDNSEGNSEIKKFTNFGIKGGLTYKVNGRNYIYANATYGTRAPFIRNSMLSPRTRNDFVTNLKSETSYSGELGYILKSPKIKARIVAYAAIIEDQTTNRGVYFDIERTFGTFVLTGINTRSFGVEAAATFEPLPGFTITPVVAWGDATYTARPLATLVADNTNEAIFTDKEVYFKGLHVANGPQAAYSLGLGYRTSSYWFFDVNFSYFDKIYIEASPIRRIDEAVDYVEVDSELWVDILSQERVKGQFVMDASIGKSFRLKGKQGKYHFLNLNANVGNVTNNTKFITGGFEQSRLDFGNKDLTKFQNKYFYSYGTNFFVGVSYRF
jgi:hypothetical protein